MYSDVRNGLPHSDIPGYNGYWHLTEAFRSQSRRSSSFLPKASIIWLLINLSPFKNTIYLSVKERASRAVFAHYFTLSTNRKLFCDVLHRIEIPEPIASLFYTF